MKIITTIIAVCAASTALYAQPVTVLDQEYGVEGNFGVGARAGLFDDQIGYLGALNAAITIDHRTVIGIEAVGVLSRIQARASSADAIVQVVYGGVLLERVFNHRDIVHPIVRVTAGGGGLVASHREPIMARVAAFADEFNFEFDPGSSMDAFVVLEPGLGAELNVGDNVRLELAVLYRLVAGVSSEGIGNALLNGPSLALTLRTGAF
jgi:hypothetical protein